MMSDWLDGSDAGVFEPYRSIFDALLRQPVDRLAVTDTTVAVYFENQAKLYLECEWRYWDVSGGPAGGQVEFAERTKFNLWRIVSKSVSRFRFSTAGMPAFAIVFSDGSSLEVLANDDFLEDWQIVFHTSRILLICMGTNIFTM